MYRLGACILEKRGTNQSGFSLATSIGRKDSSRRYHSYFLSFTIQFTSIRGRSVHPYESPKEGVCLLKEGVEQRSILSSIPLLPRFVLGLPPAAEFRPWSSQNLTAVRLEFDRGLAGVDFRPDWGRIPDQPASAFGQTRAGFQPDFGRNRARNRAPAAAIRWRPISMLADRILTAIGPESSCDPVELRARLDRDRISV